MKRHSTMIGSSELDGASRHYNSQHQHHNTTIHQCSTLGEIPQVSVQVNVKPSYPSLFCRLVNLLHINNSTPLILPSSSSFSAQSSSPQRSITQHSTSPLLLSVHLTHCASCRTKISLTVLNSENSCVRMASSDRRHSKLPRSAPTPVLTTPQSNPRHRPNVSSDDS